MFNNAYLVSSLGEHPEQSDMSAGPARERIHSAPCLLARLPSTAFIQREADYLAPKEVIKQLRRSPTPERTSSDQSHPSTPRSPLSSPGSPSETEDPISRNRRASVSSVWSSISSAVGSSPRLSKGKETRSRKIEPYQVFAAVERRDLMLLMEIRDRDFELLLRKNGDVTPLLHAMRIGHQDVAITLLGAFSRYINQLQDDEMALPRTKTRLKALRINLKLAIDFGLQTSQSDLIASFLQTLIMSEGDKWVATQVTSIAGALREGTDGKPVHNAGTSVRKFATKQLGKAEAIAALEDYVANATADLLLMAAWQCALDVFDGEHIPTYYFARDDRVYKAFTDRLDKHKRDIERKCTRRLRWQMRVLRTVLEGRTTTFRSKVETLKEEFDEGPGV